MASGSYARIATHSRIPYLDVSDGFSQRAHLGISAVRGRLNLVRVKLGSAGHSMESSPVLLNSGLRESTGKITGESKGDRRVALGRRPPKSLGGTSTDEPDACRLRFRPRVAFQWRWAPTATSRTSASTTRWHRGENTVDTH